MPSEEPNTMLLRELLVSRGIEIITSSSMVSALQKTSEFSPDLVICHRKVQEHSAFRIYSTLQPLLSQNETPFMLYMDEFNKDDVLIGLEQGIDNFIIFPFDGQSLIKRIEKQIIKSRRTRGLDTDRFKLYFDSTPVAKFIIQNDRLSNINKAFSKATGIKTDNNPLPKLSDVFDFSQDEQNRLNYRKCMNGIKEYCLFYSVPLMSNKSVLFDIHMVYNDYFGKNTFTGEIIKVEKQLDLDTIKSSSGSRNKSEVSLTQREKQVLELSAQGLSIKQIADQLGVSARTVEKHRANIMEKTDSSNIIEAIYYLQE